MSKFTILRYEYTIWTYQDSYDNAEYQIQDCVECTIPFDIDELIIDDILSCDNFHIECSTIYMRLVAIIKHFFLKFSTT